MARRNTVTRLFEDIVDSTKDFVDDLVDRAKDVENDTRKTVRNVVSDDEKDDEKAPTDVAALQATLKELQAKVAELQKAGGK
jgi:polyhydroxyalkanoate synthesis regulator phasin